MRAGLWFIADLAATFLCVVVQQALQDWLGFWGSLPPTLVLALAGAWAERRLRRRFMRRDQPEA